MSPHRGFIGGGQSFGKYETPLGIDPYDGKTFTLSAVALSNQVQPAAGLGGALEADLLSDRMPLLLKDMEVVPSASNHFKRTDSVALYAQLYDPGLATATPPAVRVSYVILDMKSGKPSRAVRISTLQSSVKKEARFFRSDSKSRSTNSSPSLQDRNPRVQRVGHPHVVRQVDFNAE